MRTPTSRPGRPARRAGFTLVETLVVAAIVAVLATMIVLPLSGSVAKAHARDAARAVLHTARLARDIAITRRTRTRLVVRADTGAFAIETEPEPLSEPGIFTPYRGTPTAHGRLPEGVRFGRVEVRPLVPADATAERSTTSRIVFLPDGRADGAVVEVVAEQAIKALTIDAGSARVELRDGPGVPIPDERRDLDA